MRKKGLVVALILLLLTTLWSGAVSAHDGEVHITIDGKVFTPADKPVIQNGRTLVPLRAITEALGATLTWEAKTSTITLVKGESEFQLTINKKTAILNGTNITLDVAPIIINNRTYVPLRFISESTGADVIWEDSTRTVMIHTRPGPGFNVLFPKDGDTVIGGTVKVHVVAFHHQLTDFITHPSAVQGEGHVHLWLDTDASNPKIAYKLTSSEPVVFKDVESGEHTLTVQLVGNDHKPLSPDVKQVIHFKTKIEESQPAAATATIMISDFQYSEKELTIKKGTKVTFMNHDEMAHTATAKDGSFDTGLIKEGESKTITFDNTGTFEYSCTPHPNMKGKIIVTD